MCGAWDEFQFRVCSGKQNQRDHNKPESISRSPLKHHNNYALLIASQEVAGAARTSADVSRHSDWRRRSIE